MEQTKNTMAIGDTLRQIENPNIIIQTSAKAIDSLIATTAFGVIDEWIMLKVLLVKGNEAVQLTQLKLFKDEFTKLFKDLEAILEKLGDMKARLYTELQEPLLENEELEELKVEYKKDTNYKIFKAIEDESRITFNKACINVKSYDYEC